MPLLLAEAAALHAGSPELQLFASDCMRHRSSVRVKGLHGQSRSGYSPERLSRFFRKANDWLPGCNEIRERIVFPTQRAGRSALFQAR